MVARNVFLALPGSCLAKHEFFFLIYIRNLHHTHIFVHFNIFGICVCAEKRVERKEDILEGGKPDFPTPICIAQGSGKPMSGNSEPSFAQEYNNVFNERYRFLALPGSCLAKHEKFFLSSA